MKQTVQLDRIQEAMKPGTGSRDGFLGNDRRNLIDILTEDDAAVKRLDLSHEQISARMRFFRDTGFKYECEFVSVEPHFEVAVASFRGRLCCPFNDTRIVRKTNVTVRNLRLGQAITYTDLNIHMIEQHGFYEGKGAVYRLEPKDLAEILEIKPEA
ncbi:MAG: hypothetical protein QGH40_02780 [bacterium]|jgi:hypothetical protein|nr:hypothetical protein [bacterium]